MPIVKTEAFVLKSFKYGGTSKIVILFTKDFGKLSAIVKGARNYKSKFCGILENMNYINIVMYLKNNRELQFISQAEYKKSFNNILTNFNKLQTAYKVIEILEKSVIEYEVITGMFDLLTSVFEKLNTANTKYQNYYLFFQINLLKLLGLSPDLSDLKENYTMETLFENNEFRINKSQFEILKSIHKGNLNNLENIDVECNVVDKLSSVYEKYLLFHTHSSKYYNTKKVFKELIN